MGAGRLGHVVAQGVFLRGYHRFGILLLQLRDNPFKWSQFFFCATVFMGCEGDLLVPRTMHENRCERFRKIPISGIDIHAVKGGEIFQKLPKGDRAAMGPDRKRSLS